VNATSFFQHEIPHEFDSVYVVESLPKFELRTGRDLYDRVIHPKCTRRGLHSHFLAPVTAREFLAALKLIEGEVSHASLSPIIHFEAHGDRSGLGLASGEYVPWIQMVGQLRGLNVLSRFNLLVVLASCSGWWIEQILNPAEPAPMWGLIGPRDRVTVSDVATGFPAFYTEFLESCNGRLAMVALNRSPLGMPWVYGFRSAANHFRTAWRSFFLAPPPDRDRRTQEIIQALTDAFGEVVQAEHIEAHIRERLQRPDAFVQTFAERYFMYELIPENRSRFPVSWSEIGKDG